LQITKRRTTNAYARSRSNVNASTGPILSVCGVLKTDPHEIAEELNDYFSSVFTKEDMQNLPQNNCSCTNRADLEDIHITEETVIMMKMNKRREDKATGADDISPRLLVEINDTICHLLTAIFHKSLQSGVVPDDWKLANVTPIYKKDNRNQPCNYRPISLTSHICKFFESIARDSIVDYLESNKLINDSQHGFRRGRSCLTNLFIFLDKVTRQVDEGNNPDVTYLDFAKAFYRVPHHRLVLKMRAIGINGRLLAWITSWLKNRKQRVGIRGSYSSWVEVMSGVQQGSVLGPILFLICINDLDESLFGDIVKFAGDTKIFSEVQTDADRQRLQDDINSLEIWSCKWQMEFNATKCKVMHVGRTTPQFQYVMNSQVLESTVQEKDLGVMITDSLKASVNCHAAYKKASRVLGLIRRTISYKSAEFLLPLYKTLF